jgi:2-polyprenyl-3-methyl-5-hydroxy-6-metoxy-1,4-benzoquinol methylase
VNRIEGDAIFLYAEKDPDPGVWSDVSARLARSLVEFVQVFVQKLAELVATTICNCEACSDIDKLRLKVIVHTGTVLVYQIGRFTEIHGLDAIIVHRLQKNSVGKDQYILLTDAAFRELAPEFPIDQRAVEHYDGIGDVPIHVHFPRVEQVRFNESTLKPFASGSVAIEILRYEVRKEYDEVATCPAKGFHFHTGRPLAKLLGYEDTWLEGLPESAIESMAGTGNPFQIAPIEEGAHVVDVGCGAGTDSLIAARMAGPSGKVMGFDMTPSMVAKARRSAARMGLTNLEFKEAVAEELPVADAWADVVISNGALNLCPDKGVVLREMSRMLKAGGRLQIGDILVDRAVPDKAKRRLDLWTG